MYFQRYSVLVRNTYDFSGISNVYYCVKNICMLSGERTRASENVWGNTRWRIRSMYYSQKTQEWESTYKDVYIVLENTKFPTQIGKLCRGKRRTAYSPHNNITWETPLYVSIYTPPLHRITNVYSCTASSHCTFCQAPLLLPPPARTRATSRRLFHRAGGNSLPTI